jgi:hypothetical protein
MSLVGSRQICYPARCEAAAAVGDACVISSRPEARFLGSRSRALEACEPPSDRFLDQLGRAGMLGIPPADPAHASRYPSRREGMASDMPYGSAGEVDGKV